MQSPDELRREIETLRDRTSKLSAAVLWISESLDVNTVLQEVVECACALTGARYGAIMTIDGDGRLNRPYEPRMMVKLLIYGYATGMFSSRGIAKKVEEDLAFRMLAAGNFPAHRTICEFRRRHLEDFRKLFVEVIRLAQAMGLANLGKLSIDGPSLDMRTRKDRRSRSQRRFEACTSFLDRSASRNFSSRVACRRFSTCMVRLNR